MGVRINENNQTNPLPKKKPQSASSPGGLHLRYMTGLDLGREGLPITPAKNVNGKQKDGQK